MLRVFAASLLTAAILISAVPVRADVKIVSAKSGVHASGKPVPRYRRAPHATAVAIPRCRLVRKSSDHAHWRGLACPRIAWAGSVPRQPWSYGVFRRAAHWEQRSSLWQSHFRPSRSHPAIYWGY